MPRYFFNLLFGDRVSQDDEEGMELNGPAAAREEAFGTIRELSDPRIGGNPRRWAGWFLQVTDKDGEFLRAPIGYPALEVVTKDWQPRRELVKRARPVPQGAAQPPDGRLAELTNQILARRADVKALTEHNLELRDEISRISSTCQELRARAQSLTARAQDTLWALDDGTNGSAPNRQRLARGEG